MAFQAFERITAARLNRLKSKTYWAQASSGVAAGAGLVDIPGCSVTFTVETANAELRIDWSADFDLTGASTALASVRPVIVGGASSPVYAVYQQGVSTDRGSAGNTWVTNVATPGSYTVKLQASAPANISLNIYNSLTVEVSEVV